MNKRQTLKLAMSLLLFTILLTACGNVATSTPIHAPMTATITLEAPSQIPAPTLTNTPAATLTATATETPAGTPTPDIMFQSFAEKYHFDRQFNDGLGMINGAKGHRR